MKIVLIKNSLVYFLTFLLFGCNENISKKEFFHIIDFEKDTIFYHLDIKEDFKKEKLLLTRQIIVGDSIMGTEMQEGIWDKIQNYCSELKKEKKEDFLCNYKYLYTIFIQEVDSYSKIISFEIDRDCVVVLRQGCTNTRFENRAGSMKKYDMQYLRITLLRADDLNIKSINIYFEEENEQWRIFSSERMGIDYYNADKTPIYCIDTIGHLIEGNYYDNFEWYNGANKEECIYSK